MNHAIYPSLEGKHVFITGGATGIGAAMVEGFFLQKAKVTFIDIDKSNAEKLVESLKQKTVAQSFVPQFYFCDLLDLKATYSVIQKSIRKTGGISVLINNVANDKRHSIEETTEESWRNCLAINLDPVFFCTQAVKETMEEMGGGSIINFSSINALLGPENMPGYVTAKSAIIGLTKSLAKELGVNNIRVNCILPGWVVTEKQLKLWLTPEAEKNWMEQVSLKKRIRPEDVANLALFLAAEESSMITGQKFIIDGGRV